MTPSCNWTRPSCNKGECILYTECTQVHCSKTVQARGGLLALVRACKLNTCEYITYVRRRGIKTCWPQNAEGINVTYNYKTRRASSYTGAYVRTCTHTANAIYFVGYARNAFDRSRARSAHARTM
jgi:hypothetical protein